MLIAVDIGNSNITFGLFRGKRLVKNMRFHTDKVSTKEAIRKIKDAFSKYDIGTIVICSVVPKAECILEEALKKMFDLKPLVLGRDIKVPIKNLYRKPSQVGQDRLVNAYAGRTLYGAPLIVVDFGTAVTFDVVSKEGSYLGGFIAPGIELSMNALAEKTALLPKIKPSSATPSIPGKSTSESMAGGIFYGFASMCDGLINKLNKRFKRRFKVIATGGNAHLVSRFSSAIEGLDRNLTLKGINLAYLALKKPAK